MQWVKDFAVGFAVVLVVAIPSLFGGLSGQYDGWAWSFYAVIWLIAIAGVVTIVALLGSLVRTTRAALRRPYNYRPPTPPRDRG